MAVTCHNPNALITQASAVESNADRPEREGGSQFGTYRRWEIVSRLLRYLRVAGISEANCTCIIGDKESRGPEQPHVRDVVSATQIADPNQCAHSNVALCAS